MALSEKVIEDEARRLYQLAWNQSEQPRPRTAVMWHDLPEEIRAFWRASVGTTLSFWNLCVEEAQTKRERSALGTT